MKEKSLFDENAKVKYDPKLDDYTKNHPNPFPRKMALANLMFDRIALYQKNSKKQQPLLTSLQTELLYLYVQEPTEKQRKQLDVFLFYLFSDDNYDLEPKQKDLQPKKKLAVKRNQLTPFQNKLLNVYDREPTEEQMLKLKDFLFRLFNNLLNKFDTKPEVEMTP